MLNKKIPLFWVLSLALFFSSSCSKNDSIPTTSDWIEHLDTTIDAGERLQLRAWIAAGLSSNSMEATVPLYAHDSDFYNALNLAKSIYDQRLIVNDMVSAVPGISTGKFVSNGLPATIVKATPFDDKLNLPASEAPNFVEVTDTVLRGGATMYRVIGGAGSYPTGGYWVLDKPGSYSDVIGGTAVQPAWNAFEVMVVYTLAAGDTMKVWKGVAAHQPIAGTENKYYESYMQQYHLEGGLVQLYVPVVYRDYQNEPVYSHFLNNIISQDSIKWTKN